MTPPAQYAPELWDIYIEAQALNHEVPRPVCPTLWAYAVTTHLLSIPRMGVSSFHVENVRMSTVCFLG